MKKTIIRNSIIVIICCSVAVIAWEKIRSNFIADQSDIKIISESKPIIKYIKIPQTVEEYKSAFNEPIKIGTYLSGNQLAIIASDNWKQTEKTLTLKNKNKFPWKPVLIAGGISFCVGGILTGAMIHKFWRK